jgi:lipoate-protein ligase A
MKLLDWTLPEAAANLACDEALLDWRDAEFDDDILRFWEPREHFVVLGYSSRIRADVELPRAQRTRIPVLRRCSGGGTVLQGPGCLNFSLVFRVDGSAPLATVSGTTRLVMDTHRAALERLMGGRVEVAGFSDLARDGLKCSGNAQRRKRRAVLFHGTFLLDVDVRLMEQLLPIPARQPPYRANRTHREFLTNLRVSSRVMKDTLASAWGAAEPLDDLPMERIETLTREVYATEAWTHRF